MPFNGEQLRIIRLYRDLNQRELAELIAVSPASISFYENGQREPDSEIVEALCDELGVIPSFFLEHRGAELRQGNFRSQGAPKRLQNRMLAQVDLLATWVRQLRELVRLPAFNVPTIRVDDQDGIEEAAEACREHWGLGMGPLRHVVRVLESAGIVVAQFHDEARQIDAFSTFDSNFQVVALSTAKGSPSRATFDLVHELGHGVMHRDEDGEETPDKESEANSFAGAFLLPRSTFARDFWSGGGTSLGHLVELKVRWGVSITAMIYRAHQLSLINTAQYRRWMKNISRKGWRSGTQEPAEPEQPRPELLPAASRRYLELAGIGASDAADLMGWTPELFEAITGLAVAGRQESEPELHSLEEYRARKTAEG